MLRYNLVDGIMIEDENGDYVLFSSYSSNMNNIHVQIDSMEAYLTMLKSYIDTLL